MKEKKAGGRTDKNKDPIDEKDDMSDPLLASIKRHDEEHRKAAGHPKWRPDTTKSAKK